MNSSAIRSVVAAIISTACALAATATPALAQSVAALPSAAPATPATPASTTMKTAGRDLPQLPGVLVLDPVSLLLLGNVPDSVAAYEADRIVKADAKDEIGRGNDFAGMVAGTEYAVSGVAKSADAVRELVLQRKADVRSHQLFMLSLPLDLSTSLRHRTDAGRTTAAGEITVEVGKPGQGGQLGGRWGSVFPAASGRMADATEWVCEITELDAAAAHDPSTPLPYATNEGPARRVADRVSACIHFVNIAVNRPNGFLLSDSNLVDADNDRLALGIVFSTAPVATRKAGAGQPFGTRDVKALYAVVWNLKTGKLFSQQKFPMESGAKAPGLTYTSADQCALGVHRDANIPYQAADATCGVPASK